MEDLLSNHSYTQILDITADKNTQNTSLPNSIEYNSGRSIKYLFKLFKYLISQLILTDQMQNYLIQWNTNVEDLFISNIISIILFISNEEYTKLDESLPISPILIVDNLGRFLNSNPPPYRLP